MSRKLKPTALWGRASALSLLVATTVAAAAPSEIVPAKKSGVPTLDGEKPTFGFTCHLKGIASADGVFNYFVFLPDNKPIGWPQIAKVKLIDGSPSILPRHELDLEGQLAGINVPPPPPSAGVVSEQRMAGLTATSASTEPLKAKLEIFITAGVERQPGRQAIARIQPSVGTLDLTTSERSGSRSLNVTCDDIRSSHSTG